MIVSDSIANAVIELFSLLTRRHQKSASAKKVDDEKKTPEESQP
jgi:hypothetical protein